MKYFPTQYKNVYIVGTGSFLPATLTETYATADIISYDGVRRVKIGREFLFDGG